MPIINDKCLTFMLNGEIITFNSVNKAQDFCRKLAGDPTLNITDHFPHLVPEKYDDNGNEVAP